MVTYMRVLDPQGHNLKMYPQVLCKCHSMDELSEGFPIPRTIFMSAYVTSSSGKSCFTRSHSFWDSWKNFIDPFFPLLDFCGKPKPSTEFCVQLLGFARVWSGSASQTSSYVHVSDSTSWQRVADAAYRGWRCSALGCYCSKERLKLFTFLSAVEKTAQETDPVPLTLFCDVWQDRGVNPTAEVNAKKLYHTQI